jgi:hypothetical protein
MYVILKIVLRVARWLAARISTNTDPRGADQVLDQPGGFQ